MLLFIAIISGPIGLESIIVQYIDWTLELKTVDVSFTSDWFYSKHAQTTKNTAYVKS